MRRKSDDVLCRWWPRTLRSSCPPRPRGFRVFDFYSRYHLVSPRSRCQTTASRAAARANAIKRAACAPQEEVSTDELALSRPGHSYTRLSRLAAATDTMMFSRALAAICLLAVAYAKPVTRNMRVHERRADVPASFTPVGAAAPETMLKLRIQLAQSDIAGLDRKSTRLNSSHSGESRMPSSA